jgi:hypothetical protein
MIEEQLMIVRGYPNFIEHECPVVFEDTSLMNLLFTMAMSKAPLRGQISKSPNTLTIALGATISNESSTPCKKTFFDILH